MFPSLLITTVNFRMNFHFGQQMYESETITERKIKHDEPYPENPSKFEVPDNIVNCPISTFILNPNRSSSVNPTTELQGATL